MTKRQKLIQKVLIEPTEYNPFLRELSEIIYFGFEQASYEYAIEKLSK